jgi:hypothetical protein
MDSPTLFFRWERWAVMLALLALLVLSGCSDGSTSQPGTTSPFTPQPTTPLQQPTLTPLTGWQTYQDATYLFALQYPPDWTAQAITHSDLTPPYEEVDFFPRASGPVVPAVNVITISVTQATPESPDSGVPQGFAPIGTVTLAGQDEQVFAGPDPSGGQDLLVQFAANDELFYFTSRSDLAAAAAFRQTFLQMLSTFQQG